MDLSSKLESIRKKVRRPKVRRPDLESIAKKVRGHGSVNRPTLVERLKEKEDEVKGIVSEYEREKHLIPQYAEVLEGYKEHPLVWRVMNTDMTFEQDIQETLVDRYKSRFKKYIFDRVGKDFSLRVSMYESIYGYTLNPNLDNVWNLFFLLSGFGIIALYGVGKDKDKFINSLLEQARYLDYITKKVKKLEGG